MVCCVTCWYHDIATTEERLERHSTTGQGWCLWLKQWKRQDAKGCRKHDHYENHHTAVATYLEDPLQEKLG